MAGTWVFDMETFPNRTLFCAYGVEERRWVSVWRHAPDAVAQLTQLLREPDTTWVGFNSRWFDCVIAAAWCGGRSEAEMKTIADDLIGNRLAPWDAVRKYALREPRLDHIDLIEVAPSFVGLKAYGARMHMPRLQDMPLRHDLPLLAEHERVVLEYCRNDVETTVELLRRLDSELALRVDMSRRYGVDMRSRSDTQMAETAFVRSLGLQRKENKVPPTVRYTPPEFLRFRDPGLAALLAAVSEHTFPVNPATGHVTLPDFLGAQTVKLNAGVYQLGVGGIHSTHDRQVCHIAGDDVICDIDAASFYPSIILECGFVPAGLGQRFSDEYRSIYTRRLEAKRAGDKATDATLKISLNGTFGKLASRFSPLYSPDLMLAVTLTGQFTLLMLIEWLEHLGAVTLSANTDGIAMRYPGVLEAEVQAVVARFTSVSRFNFEFTPYRVLAMKDVNNYFAVKLDRSVKARGIYAPLSLKKNPTAGVCAAAVGQWLACGTPMLETIKAAPFTDFVSARSVTGGGQQAGEYLGRVVRWYQSTDPATEPIRYASNGNKVPKTDGARACMVIADPQQHPPDLDYGWYYREACRIAEAVGCRDYLTADERQLIAPLPKAPRKKKST